MKHALIITALIICCCGVAFSQDKPLATKVPQLKTEELLKVREIQLGWALRALHLKEIEEQYKALQEKQDADLRRLDAFVAESSKAAGIDPNVWELDMDTLQFFPRLRRKYK